MSPVTEIVHLELIEGNPHPDEDEQSKEGQTWKESMETLKSQKGVQRVYWGREIENPDRLVMFVDWDHVELHHEFIAKDYYQPFLEKIGSIVCAPPRFYHVRFDPHPPTPALRNTGNPSQPLATEFLSMYFPTSYSSEDQEKLNQGINKLLTDLEKNAANCYGSAVGWADEDVSVPGSAIGHEQAKLLVICIGWESVDAHMKFKETPMFKDNIHVLRGAKDLKSAKMVHVGSREA